MQHAVRCDVAVIGLGVMGAMTLWQAARRSASVIGIEQFEIGHARGSSHGGSRIFRRIVPEGPAYVPLVRRADELWSTLQATSEVPLRTVTGGITIGTVGGDLVRGALDAADAGNVEIEVLDAADIRRRFGQHAVFDDDAAVYEPGAGVIYPEPAIRAAIDRAVQAGAEVRTGERITGLRADPDGVQITTTAGAIRARRAVLATGAWLTDLVPELGLPIRVQRSVPYWFSSPDPNTFGPAAFPVFVRRSHHLSGWGVPDVDGRGVKIGVSGAPKPYLRRPEDNWHSPGPQDLALVQEFCVEAFPGLAASTPTGYPCMNAKTPDRDFLIGTSARAPGLVLAGGFSGHGFKYATAVGEIAADLALDRQPGVPISAFDPDRPDRNGWAAPFAPVFEPPGGGAAVDPGN